MSMTAVASVEGRGDDNRMRPTFPRSKSESSAQLMRRRSKSRSPEKGSGCGEAVKSGDESWKTQLAKIQRLMKAVLLFLACIIKQETSPLPTGLQPKAFLPAEKEAHRTPNFDWEVVRRQLDSTFTSLTKCWKEFGSGLDTLLRSDDDLGDTLDSTKKINEDDCMELHEAISDIIPPLKEFAARLGSLVYTSCANPQMIDPVLRAVTEKLRVSLGDLGPWPTQNDDDKGCSTVTSSSTTTKTETEPLDHHMTKLKELQDSLIDLSIPLQVKIRSEDFRRQTKPHRPLADESCRPTDSTAFPHKRDHGEQDLQKRRVRFEENNSAPAAPHPGRVFARAKATSRSRSLSFGAKSPTSELPDFIPSLRKKPSSDAWSEIKATVSRLTETWNQIKQTRIDTGDLVTGEFSRVVVRMSTDINAFISPPIDDMDEADRVEVTDPQGDLVKSDDVDAIQSATSGFRQMDLSVTSTDLELHAVLALMSRFPETTKSWTSFSLPSSLQEPLLRNAAARSLLNSFWQWSCITQRSNVTLASSLLGRLQETLIDQVLGSMREICDHPSDIFGNSPSAVLSHVVSILDDSMNHLLRAEIEVHLTPAWAELEPGLRSASAATTVTSCRLSQQLARETESSSILKRDPTLDIIAVPPLFLLVYLSSKEGEPKPLIVSSKDLKTSFIWLTPNTVKGVDGKGVPMAIT